MLRPVKRRIELPNGKIIEAIIGEPVAEIVTGDGGLNYCAECGSHLCYPATWQEHDAEHWEIVIRCPECEMRHHVIAPQEDCDYFDIVIEEGSETLMRDYKRLVAENLAEEIEQFVKALDLDVILPEDFAPPSP